MKKTVNIKVEKELWVKAQDDAFKKLNKKAKIDGFRPGKAPRSVFERNYPGQITMEAADILVDQEYRRIITEDKILPIIEPKIDLVKLSDDELEVNFTFITEPTVKLGEYKNLKVKKPAVKVSKEADPSNNKISNESPLAHAIMNAKVGDVRSVESPNGTYDVEIVEIL